MHRFGSLISFYADFVISLVSHLHAQRIFSNSKQNKCEFRHLSIKIEVVMSVRWALGWSENGDKGSINIALILKHMKQMFNICKFCIYSTVLLLHWLSVKSRRAYFLFSNIYTFLAKVLVETLFLIFWAQSFLPKARPDCSEWTQSASVLATIWMPESWCTCDFWVLLGMQ